MTILSTTIIAAEMGAPLELLARVLGTDAEDLLARIVSDGLDAALADPDVRAAYDALARLDNRRNNAPAAEDASADYGTTRPFTNMLVHVDRGDGFTHSGEAKNRCDVRGSLPSHGEAASGYAPASEAAPSTKAAQLSPTERHDIGHAVREKRIARGLSQRQVAAELGISAVSLGYVEAGAPKASVKIVAACEKWEAELHSRDFHPRLAARRLPRTAAPVEPASPQDDELEAPRAPKSVTPEATRRLAASKVREARRARGIPFPTAASMIGIELHELESIECARQVDADVLRKACQWAQAAQP